MKPTTGRKRELLAIASLLAGIFVGLALLPWEVTGPAGRVVGDALAQYLGVGAVLVPALGVVAGLAGLGRVPRVRLQRAAVVTAGLVVLLPFAIALGIGIRTGDQLPPSYDRWAFGERAVGVIPAALAVLLQSVVGTAGAVLVGLAGLSGLTLYTFDWHPFLRLTGRGRHRLEAEVGAGGRSDSAFDSGTVGPTSDAVSGVEARSRSEEATRGGGLLRRLRRAESRDPGGQLDELPPIGLLAGRKPAAGNGEEGALDALGEVLIDTLRTFRVEGRIVGRTTGPVVTQFEVAPAPGVKVGRIAALADDLALAMRAKSIRIVAPIPGKAAVGVEVPNPTPQMVPLRDLLETDTWRQSGAVLPIPLGKDLEGRPIVADLEKMPHLLIAGATGSGKSVCVNSIVTGLVYRYTPRELRMLMIDPKMVELSMYKGLPHLRHPVVTDNKQAAQTLKWAIHEMERRYALFHANGARNVQDFNRKVRAGRDLVAPGPWTEAGQRHAGAEGEQLIPEPEPYTDGPLPYIVLVLDELADLMMTVQGEVEKPLAILAQKARATGIHLILATQRPSVNVITGLIKANFPSRIAFRVASKVDSRTILDQNGAETLLGNGDMLFLPPGRSEPMRVQGAFIGTEETERLVSWYADLLAAREAALAGEGLGAQPEEDILEVVAALEAEEATGERGGTGGPSDRDPLFREAAETCISHQLGSTSLLQRRLRIGYGRAARIIDQLHDAGILGPPDGSKPREVLVGMNELDDYSD